ncbi:hypothetical protein D9M72_323110 [compost metagenome]
MARAKPSAEELSNPPCRSSFGAKAIEWTTASSPPHTASMRANSARICPGSSTFSGIRTGACTASASGATCG